MIERVVETEFVFDRLQAAELSAAYRILVPERPSRSMRAGQEVGCPAFSGLLNLRSLCGELRIQVFGADFARCPVAECGVNSSLIVEQFDVAGNVLLRFLP